MTGGEGQWKAVEGGAALRQPTVIVSAKGAARWQAGHPWIYRTDLYDEPGDAPGIVAVTDRRGRHLGQALYSPKSEIRLRLLTRGREPVDATWWQRSLASGAGHRRGGGARDPVSRRPPRRTENRGVPRPAGEPRAGGRARGPGPGARPVHLPRLVRAASRAPGDRGGGDRLERGGARPGTRE